MQRSSIAARLASLGRQTLGERVRHQTARARVAEATRGFLQNPGTRPLDGREVARIRDYARRTFGSAGYAPWLEFYTLFRGEFHEGWIPASFFQNVAIQRINGPLLQLGDSRSLITRLLATPLLPDLAHYVGGEWRDVCGARLDRDRVAQLLFAERDEVCVKADSSFKGRGISFVRRDDLDLAEIEQAGSLVVQSVIRQHPSFDAFSPGAVATLRVSTGKLAGKAPFVVGTYLRCGLGTARAVGLTSLRVPIPEADGALGPLAYGPTWQRFATHPETGAAFAGARIPAFGDLTARCVELHDRLPQLGFIGWDVTLDAAGEVRLMEANTGHPDVKFIEMTQGPTLRAFRIEAYAAR